jgi:mannosylglycerate hydrolase
MQEPLNLHIISHTHWDREWYLTFQQFRFRLVELIDDLLDLLNRDPEFRFFHLDGQTIVLEDYLQIRPQREAELRALIRSGRVLVGPWYVQPDEFLVSGESIVRNLQIGRRIARDFGESMPIGYLPDSFGHIGQMPQIMQGFDLDTFVHGRGVFASQTGGTEYWWQGLDGSRLLGIFLVNWYDNARRFPEDPDEALAFVNRVVARLKQANAGQDLLLMNGVDHLVAQDNLTAIRKGLDERYAEGRLHHTTLPEAIDRLRQAAGPQLRTIAGELRNEGEGTLLTGVLSARVHLKQANNASERLLETWVEPYETWAALLGKRYDRDFLRYAWKTLLHNHPHDSICGCSIDQVHREMLPRFDQAQQVGQELLDRALAFIAAQADTTPCDVGDAVETTAVLIHNPLPRPRSDVAIFELDFAQRPDYYAIELLDDRGRSVPVQTLRRTQRLRKQLSPIDIPQEIPVSRYTVAAYFEDVPACGYRSYTARLLKRLPKTDGDMAILGGLANEHLRVMVAADGTLTIADQQSGAIVERLNFFRDEGDIGDQYNYYKPVADRVVETLGGSAEITVLCSGPVIAELEIVTRPRLPLAARPDHEGRSDETIELPIRSRVRLLRGSDRVEISTALENTVKDHRLRAIFPLHAPVTSALADTSFGVIDRPVEIPSFWPFSSRDRPHRSFVDLRAAGRGLTLLSRGLYEHDLRPDGQLELTLLRCVGQMFIDFSTLEPRDPVVEGQCPGPYRFEYALQVHDGTKSIAEIADAAAAFNAPLRAWQTDHHAGSQPSRSFLQLEPSALQLSAVKRAEDRDTVIVRCFNTTDQAVLGTLQLPGPWRAAYRTNLDEDRLESLPLGDDGTLTLHAEPWQIVTVELEPLP